MKKFLTIFFLAVLPLMAFTSCDDDKDEPGASAIAGRYYDVNYPADYIELKADGSFVDVSFDEDGFINSDYGTYVYNAPNITLRYPDGESMSGTISGNTMTFIDKGDADVYIKR